jgi:hypothetical protein
MYRYPYIYAQLIPFFSTITSDLAPSILHQYIVSIFILFLFLMFHISYAMYIENNNYTLDALQYTIFYHTQKLNSQHQALRFLPSTDAINQNFVCEKDLKQTIFFLLLKLIVFTHFGSGIVFT